VVIVGAGRLGGALALALAAKGWSVRLHSRGDDGRQRAEALGLKAATPADLRRARVVLLCVPDAAVPTVAKALSTTLPRTAALVHTAGALSLDSLGTAKGRARGSFHPLCAVSSPRDSLAGHAVAVSTRSRALRDVLRRMAVDVGLQVLDVPEAHRAAYHAGAVMSAGGLVALARTSRDVDGIVFGSYLVTTATILPVAFLWGVSDDTRWGPGSLLVGGLVVAVLALRLLQLWVGV